MNHFELFKLPCQFQLDTSLLSLHFRELQRHFHPDKFATASGQERLLSVQKAAQINDAYQTLRDPLRRAQYLLFLHGIPQDDEQQTLQDTDFLMQQMALREELDEIEQAENAVILLSAFDLKVSEYLDVFFLELEACLNDKHWLDAASRVKKLKFMVKLKQEIERTEDRLLG